ncbi:hypothetical protein B9Z19DRAFT_435424 [Tuber borchii]|uniref:C2H2-type domain-containing protein n=1 Tax=Tuber borchii TaxID=42251 RepID=A0A2T6ZGB9_TUBBO|nr:hypothetical protein B9Z19DRAFT_435424 [Tuber borchii]
MEHNHSGCSAQSSRQNSPPTWVKLKLRANRSRGGRCPPGMMNPFTRKTRAEKPRGRGAGEKAKERKVSRFNHASDYKKHKNQRHLRPFLCVFFFAGRNQKFGNKNEWKRHVNSQYLQLFYRHCYDSLCADRKAIFNRKDLFGQHLKRMHPPPAGSKSSAASGDRTLPRRAPTAAAGEQVRYCERNFEGPQGWEQRMEHVGQHYQKNYKEFSNDCWVPDEGLIKWALEHGIIEDNNDGGYTIISTGKDAIVKAGVEQKKLAREGMARMGYAEDGDLDFDAESEDEYMHD